MAWWTGKRGSAAPAAPAVADTRPRHERDATEGFPRGLPDGDRHKPSALGRWPSADEMAEFQSRPDGPKFGEWKPGMFLVGRDHKGRYYGHDDDRHVLTVAGSRAGKGVSLIVPNLLFWPGSALVIDPKGELATLTASRRSAGGSDWSVPLTPGEGEVYALDPFSRVTGDARQHAFAGFNPLADLDPATGEGADLAYQLADALIIQSDGDGAHWTQAARALLTVLVMWVAATEPPASKNLVTVRRIVTKGEAALNALWVAMAEHGIDLIGRTGEAMQGTQAKELNSIISTIATQTAFLEGEQMARVLSASSFRLEDLKAKRITVYLCLPATRLATHGRWLRMFVTLAMDAMERTGPLRDGQHRVLFCLDEFAALGTMETVEKAAGQIASFGVKLWPIIQDLTQLKRDYKDGWETFMGNAGLLTFFGNTDLTTTDHIAARLGETEVVRIVESANETWQDAVGGSRGDPMMALVGGQSNNTESTNQSKGGGQSKGEQIQRVPLMHASEIVQAFSRERGNILVMIPDKPPCALHRCVHHSEEDDGLFGGLFGTIEGQKPPRTKRAEREERESVGKRA
ncbi:type IV secretory system conjugative DNA transfer family protein [Lichenifustis flavocetrariae]|uniref:Type IV secretory system conjugative DNA transfer family protein n=1 Tax=Lichenifustis flavocetrariae TaxID=2949735 RepID=A0AA41Z3T7_9HYPH|nr:type IV secretory system conjugative DNA transfer family protein [Lichenifustis flavocetrariae]MCW6512270.1 type IV secretory system conjugative DNA transfer family protein [Lichenifustis flavocetrariae]